MIRRVWAWLRDLRKEGGREGSTTPEVDMMLQESEVKMHEAEIEAMEAEALTQSLRQMRVENRFRERMVLKIQGGISR